MSWELDAERVAALPLILAGPILRRVDKDEVSVWVALRDARSVTLTVYADPTGSAPVTVTSPPVDTLRLGNYLHLALVTLTGLTLIPGALYAYDLAFTPIAGALTPLDPVAGSTLHSPGVMTRGLSPAASLAQAIDKLSYHPSLTRPSFALSPPDVRDLRLVHGSCRDPGPDGEDALVALDIMIAGSVLTPLHRPHLLVLTGDQIYADQGDDFMLTLATDVGESLFGWFERIPQLDKTARQLPPPTSRLAVTALLGLDQRTRTLRLTLSEFCATYLLWWSPALWPTTMPPSAVGPRAAHAASFLRDLPRVQRALANVPTYMIFDDHEVIDDWNLIEPWCQKVYSQPIGQRIVMNGLLSYALFQAWGNDPRRPEWTGPFAVLQTTVASVVAAGAITPAHHAALCEVLAVPVPVEGEPFDVSDLGRWHGPVGSPPTVKALPYHFSVRGEGYELLGFDERTWRKFPADGGFLFWRHRWGDLMGAAALAAQLPAAASPPPAVTFVASSAAVIMSPTLWYVQAWLTLVALQKYASGAVSFDYVRFYDKDRGDSWLEQSAGFERLLARLAQRTATTERPGRIVVLAGDLHWGYAARLHYDAARPFEALTDQPTAAVLAHFVSSGMRREDHRKRQYGRNGYYTLDISGMPSPRSWFGWNDNGQLIDHPSVTDPEFWQQHPSPHPQLESFMRSLSERDSAAEPTSSEDWRYRIDFLLAESTPAPELTTTFTSGASLLQRTADSAKAYRKYAERHGVGKEIVGRNNLGEVVLAGDAAHQVDAATQILWWRLVDGDAPEPLTRHTVSFITDDLAMPLESWVPEVEP